MLKGSRKVALSIVDIARSLMVAKYVGFGVELAGSPLLAKLIRVVRNTVSSKTAGMQLLAECWICFAVVNFLFPVKGMIEEGR